MSDQTPFVVNDRRKFTADGDWRNESAPRDAQPETQSDPAQASSTEATSADRPGPKLVSMSTPVAEPETDFPVQLEATAADEEQPPLPALPPAEQLEEAARAYTATADRLDTLMRASNPGAEHLPPMTFERLVQSLYTQALLLLGGATQPGETPRVDILGARQTIDMLAVIAEKSSNNLSADEDNLLQSGLFDLHMAFLEITQALAQQARTTAPVGASHPAGSGPRIVR